MHQLFKGFFCLTLFIIIAGCGSRNELAPVSELRSQAFSRSPNVHIVHRGETLYAIAFGYDTDFRQLARLNNLRPPYKLRVGQVLHVRPGQARKIISKPQYVPRRTYLRPQKPHRPIKTPVITTYTSGAWYWPLQGKIITSFIPNQGKKGINIASHKGEKVHAASSGVVAYAGSGLAGYGNLIIIKHNNEFLTAYGNNSKNLVSEGQRVNAGQVIAEVGVIDHKYWGVHFEIRKMGIPVNPLNYLKKG
ncbi:peptidoglycan DD-metalloendopeptidase family protein [Legionella sp. km772]|uniref:peptidoglycan DD-metalloendopeptidase family protein n=1 Tax=Legionella sp. km772 TaxID=2498111 RepID=UPI000F8CD18F|nr:peptidoglycan DD-metalloendopeptidase family protein [Legionella sp. km772]RUR12368.1 LysM peptidoglycan-binding domain-containing protein [Legionella sp. km772]